MLTSGQVEREKRAAQRRAQAWMFAAGTVLFLFVVIGGSLNGLLGAALTLTALCALAAAFTAQTHAAKLGRMATFFNEGRCPNCAERIVDAWRVRGRGVRCPECGLDQDAIDQTCKACGYDLQGCSTLSCEPVKQMNCAMCKAVYVQED